MEKPLQIIIIIIKKTDYKDNKSFKAGDLDLPT